MLVYFSVANFKSLAKKQVLSLESIPTLRSSHHQTVRIGGSRLLKTAVIYGANASGKSNLILALQFMQWIVTHATQLTSVDELPFFPFKLDKAYLTQPTQFEIAFQIKKEIWSYGFEYTATEIQREWLSIESSLNSDSEKQPLFVREKQQLTYINEKRLPELTTFDMGTLLRNTLLLPRLDQINSSTAKQMLTQIATLVSLSGVNDASYKRFTDNQFKSNVTDDDILKITQFADPSINAIHVTEKAINADHLPPRLTVNGLLHTVSVDRQDLDNQVVSFDLEKEESEGTKKIYHLAGPLADILKQGRIALIDELDAKLHPLLTQQLIRCFYDETFNPNHAQLIFATHDVALLDASLFRKDQIWFTDKTAQGETALYSLAEFKDVSVKKLQQSYLKGCYGSIPFFYL